MSYPGQGQWGPPQNGGQWGPPPEQNQQWQQPGPPQGPPPGQGQWGQQPQQGGWPQQGQPAQGYGGPPPGQGQWGQAPQQGQWGQQPQQQPAAPVVKGSLGAFYSQPTVGGGAGLKFPQVGSEHYAIVNRTVTSQDVEQQTGMGKDQDKLQYHNDGSPKWVLKIPVNTRPGPDYQDGKARWYCYGAARDLLNAKIAQSGAPVVTEMTPDGPVQAYVPEPGSLVRIKKAGTRKVPGGLNDANMWEVDYWRPDQAVIAAPQLGIEYPTVAELSQVTAPEPAGSPTPTATPPTGTGQVMGQPGGYPAAAPAANQFPNPAMPAQGGMPGPPPTMDWQAQQQPQNANGGYIPPATNQPQGGPPPGMAPDTQQLQQSLTGRPG